MFSFESLPSFTELVQSKEKYMNQCFAAYTTQKLMSINDLQRLLTDLFKQDTPTEEKIKQLAQEVINVFDYDLDQSLNEIEFSDCWFKWLAPCIRPNNALLVIDVQNDFISGSLALINAPCAEQGQEVVPIINKLQDKGEFKTVVYTQDWHPNDHMSFFDNHHLYNPVQKKVNLLDKVQLRLKDSENLVEQVMWPTHCVQNSWGAQLHEQLKIRLDAIWLRKGIDKLVDSYSAFWDNQKIRETGLQLQLVEQGVTDLYVCGLAYDFCVGESAMHAHELNFNTTIIMDAVRSICPESRKKMRSKLDELGILHINSDEFLTQPKKRSFVLSQKILAKMQKNKKSNL